MSYSSQVLSKTYLLMADEDIDGLFLLFTGVSKEVLNAGTGVGSVGEADTGANADLPENAPNDHGESEEFLSTDSKLPPLRAPDETGVPKNFIENSAVDERGVLVFEFDRLTDGN